MNDRLLESRCIVRMDPAKYGSGRFRRVFFVDLECLPQVGTDVGESSGSIRQNGELIKTGRQIGCEVLISQVLLFQLPVGLLQSIPGPLALFNVAQWSLPFY